jgi:hypothetical protein
MTAAAHVLVAIVWLSKGATGFGTRMLIDPAINSARYDGGPAS